MIRQALVVARVAILWDVFDHALGSVGVGPLEIVHDKQIEQAVIVHVDPDCSHGPQWPVFRIVPLVEARFLRHVGECSVTVVAVEGIAVDAGDKDIRVSIVVVVPDCDAEVNYVGLKSWSFFGSDRSEPTLWILCF